MNAPVANSPMFFENMTRVKIIQNCVGRLFQTLYCGDGCCSWRESYQTDLCVGEEYDEYSIDLNYLSEGVDFVFID
jgi:hypothetical protein